LFPWIIHTVSLNNSVKFANFNLSILLLETAVVKGGGLESAEKWGTLGKEGGGIKKNL
jgi:hypothetical protein